MIRSLHAAARRLLRATLPIDMRDAVIGDLDDEVDEKIAAGVSPRAALAWSLRQTIGSLPSAARLRLASRIRPSERSAPHVMQGIRHDIRDATRLLRRAPLLAAAIVGTLSLGIGATTAIFSVVHAALLRELPYHQPDRIVVIYETFRGRQFTRGVVNPSNFDFWERHATSFSHMAAMSPSIATLTNAGDPVHVNVRAVLPSFFDTIGVFPAIGRPLTANDGEGERPVLLSHELWMTRFGGDADVGKRRITLDGTDRPVAGVMPAGFGFPNRSDIWQVLTLSAQSRASSRAWYLGAIARLKPGIDASRAQVEMDAIAEQLQAAQPARQKNRGVYLVPLREDLVFRVEDGLRLLQGAVIVVLLIAVANVANLLVAHGTGRQREFAVRAAIGASRARIIRQLLAESLILGFAGAAGGLLLAFWGVPGLVALSPLRLPDDLSPAVNTPVLFFALATGLIASIVFGVAPAIIASRTDIASPVKEAAVAGTRTVATRLRGTLVAGETALTVMLLVGAGLLVRSFSLLLAQDVGFAADHVVTAETTLPAQRYDTAEKRAQFWRALFDRLEALPGVTAAGGSTAVPFSNWEWQTDFRIFGRENVRNHGTGIRVVHPGYFAALMIPVLKGRAVTDADTAKSEPAVVINDAFAREYLEGLDPVGQRVRLGREPSAVTCTIVGVTGNTRHYRLEEPAQPEVYRPLAQAPPSTLVLAIRTSHDPRGLTSLVTSAIHAIDRDLPVEGLLTMEQLIGRTVSERRFYLTLMSGFASLALLLAVVGVYGVMSYAVGQRRREIGIRVALGAAPRQVENLVLRSALFLVVPGLLIGAFGAHFTSALLSAMLFGVSSGDPATMAAVVAALGACSLGAAYLPARRARRTDPIVALRGD